MKIAVTTQMPARIQKTAVVPMSLCAVVREGYDHDRAVCSDYADHRCSLGCPYVLTHLEGYKSGVARAWPAFQGSKA